MTSLRFRADGQTKALLSDASGAATRRRKADLRVGTRRPFVRALLAFHRLMARAAERLMTVPLISVAQVRILEEEVIEAARAPDLLPEGLEPSTQFDAASIRAGLPEPGGFRLRDLRWFAERERS